MKEYNYIVYRYNDGSIGVYKLINERLSYNEMQVAFCKHEGDIEEYRTELYRSAEYLKFDTYEEAMWVAEEYNQYSKKCKDAKKVMDGIFSNDKNILRKLKLKKINENLGQTS